MYSQPDFLKPGNKIGIIAPARAIEENKIVLAEKIITSWGLTPVRGKNLLGKQNQFSGNIEERLSDLQFMLDNPDIKAILCAGGGYGAVQLAEFLDFEKFKLHPKWVTGFSDITVLHAAIFKHTDIPTIHGTMPVKFGKSDESLESLKKALFGDLMKISLKPDLHNISGSCTGTLVGGNLSILASLIGTSIDLDYSGKILFIEEVDEYLYHIDRMMYSLKLSGKLAGLKGLVVGDFSDIHDNEIAFGKNIQEIILSATQNYGYPVAFGFNAGHENLNLAFYLGKKVTLQVNKSENKLTFH